MAEHLVIWQIDKTGIDSDIHREGSAACRIEAFCARVRKDIEFYNCTFLEAVNGQGYALLEGNLSDIILDLQRYRPYLKFKVRPASYLDQAEDMLEKMKAEPTRNLPNIDAIAGYSLNDRSLT